MADERRLGFRARAVILHDAEDMVHPAALGVLDAALEDADFVQLPVRPEPQPASRWVAGHYADEFAESHARAMVVRDWLGVGLPAAGVGCAFSRTMIERLAARRGAAEPFAPDSLTEDYECGLLIGEFGGRARFLRLRDAEGRLIATREFFPARWRAAVRQKTRWLHGIAFQGWDRLGWRGRGAERWMRLRDRRGPIVALVLAAAYALIALQAPLLLGERLTGFSRPTAGGLLRGLLLFNLAALVWRLGLRALFTAREYGWREGACAVVRVQVSNFVAIFAARRALRDYVRSLRGAAVRWDKTFHRAHPALEEAPR